MAYGYPYQAGMPGGMPSYFNTNYMPQMQQQMPQAQQMQTPQQTANVTWIYVNGLEGARNQIVQPGQTAWMMDNNDPVIYIKAVDNMGSATLRSFQLSEIGQREAQAGDAKYASAEALAAAQERIGRLEASMGTLLKELGGAKDESVGANHG